MRGFGHGGNRRDETFVRHQKEGRTSQTSAAGSVLNTVAEKRDRAFMVRVIRIGVQRPVELRTDGHQAQTQNQQRAKNCDPAQGWLWFKVGVGEIH